MKLLASYFNGNYSVRIFDDGTKIRENNLDFFRADFPENIDLKITDCCNMGCSMCHEGSSIDGEHADLMSPSFLDYLQKGTELAIGGGNVLEHPDFIKFLKKMSIQGIICNVTVHQQHFMENLELFKELTEKKLIWGLGVSLSNPTNEFISEVKKFPDLVIHVINGILTVQDFWKLSGHGLKMLILGYKKLRRGTGHFNLYSMAITQRQKELKKQLDALLPLFTGDKFSVISFDNLALEQLNAKEMVPEQMWNEFYMGADGTSTMYCNLVERYASTSSTHLNRYFFTDGDKVEHIFDKVRTD